MYGYIYGGISGLELLRIGIKHFGRRRGNYVAKQEILRLNVYLKSSSS